MNRVVDTRLCYALLTLALGACESSGQQLNQAVPLMAACVELNGKVLIQVRNADLAAVEETLAAAPSGAGREATLCRGLVLNNVAAVLVSAGRDAEAESIAGRSLEELEKIYPSDDPALLRPLQILAASRLAQGKRAMARESLKRMQTIRIEGPEDSALIHGISGALMQAEGRRREAEVEDLAALHAWQKAGRGETADAASFLSTLGSLYIEEQQLDDASRALDQSLNILNHAQDTTEMDRIRLLYLRGILHAKQHEWRNSEQDFSRALSIMDAEPIMDVAILRPLLTNYALVLRKDQRRKEAHAMEARAAALGPDYARENIVDVTALMPKPKRVGKR